MGDAAGIARALCWIWALEGLARRRRSTLARAAAVGTALSWLAHRTEVHSLVGLAYVGLLAVGTWLAALVAVLSVWRAERA